MVTAADILAGLPGPPRQTRFALPAHNSMVITRQSSRKTEKAASGKLAAFQLATMTFAAYTLHRETPADIGISPKTNINAAGSWGTVRFLLLVLIAAA